MHAPLPETASSLFRPRWMSFTGFQRGFFSYRPGRTAGTLRLVSSPPAKIYVVGIGSDGLAGVTARARELVTSAELLLGSEQTLDWLPEAKAERRRIGSDLQEAVRLVE